MNLRLLLTTCCALTTCGVHACPHLCSCSFSPSGAEVECSDTSMTSFPVDALPPNSTRLSIQSTQLSTIKSAHLSAVPLLRTLQLYHNKLEKLPWDLLTNASQLTTLDLTGNHLVRLPAKIFKQKSLRKLLLKDNLLEEADADWFVDNSSLILLDISGNHLSHIPSAFLHKLKHLQHLDLSHNNLEELQAGALKNLHHLDTLNLARNKLSALNPSLFNHTRKLSRLFLQENHLRELQPTLLLGLQRLQMLLLNQNQLQHLPQGLLDGRNSTFQMVLTGNPWQCDEKMEYLWRWLNDHPHNVFFLDEVTCAGPETLKNRPVVSLTEQELGLARNDDFVKDELPHFLEK
ncbi:phospholipase A2 inhibitor-like [Dunckerocampus dactyliophorus]|uniref:phospholipase A2 inhibitor-like n=1 Tax=Dunckerocampus dactyliophorus TaxID=161453 RepID=UPI0024064B87|nr:phospholipase A2 inhibitor-like [Dunckerocampus dactyliophorus]